MAGSGFTIGVLGAECTGKSTLAVQLRNALAAQGTPATVVPEGLRQFCQCHGRSPRQDEQRAIADEHSARIALAAAQGIVVVADTTALSTAVYSEFYFGDTSLYPMALRQHRRCGLTLLTGLDLPWHSDGHQRDGPAARLAVDGLLRRVLDRSALAYAVVTGKPPARVQQAMAALARAQGSRARPRGEARWAYRCEGCGGNNGADPPIQARHDKREGQGERT